MSEDKKPILTRTEAEGFAFLGAIVVAAFVGGVFLGRRTVAPQRQSNATKGET